jgi:TonB family protein
VISKVDPLYSEEARRAKVQSAVMLSIVVNLDGRAENIKILHGAGFGLDERAVEAVTKWKFQPGTLRGVAVKVRAQVEVNFRLGPQFPSARLNFTLPQGATRPQLTAGSIPKGLPLEQDQSVSFHLVVDAEGVPQNITVLNSSDPEWERITTQELQQWRFSPAMLNGTAVAVEGVFELSWKVPAQRQ